MITKIIHKLGTKKSLSWTKGIFKTSRINTLFNCGKVDAFFSQQLRTVEFQLLLWVFKLCAEGTSHRIQLTKTKKNHRMILQGKSNTPSIFLFTNMTALKNKH